MIKFTKGFLFRYRVKTNSSKLIIKGDYVKYTCENIVSSDDGYYIAEPAEVTKGWDVGVFKYQILNDDGIEDSGEIEILPNFALMDEGESVRSHWEVVLEAVENTLAGKATQAQTNISVGDKSIGYMSVTELLELREFAKEKIAEEKGKFTSGKGGKILHKWVMR
jgi:hypothetical protein